MATQVVDRKGHPEPAHPVGSEREALAGLVERVTFHNPESGFSVLQMKARGQRDLVTVVSEPISGRVVLATSEATPGSPASPVLRPGNGTSVEQNVRPAPKLPPPCLRRPEPG